MQVIQKKTFYLYIRQLKRDVPITYIKKNLDTIVVLILPKHETTLKAIAIKYLKISPSVSNSICLLRPSHFWTKFSPINYTLSLHSTLSGYAYHAIYSLTLLRLVLGVSNSMFDLKIVQLSGL